MEDNNKSIDREKLKEFAEIVYRIEYYKYMADKLIESLYDIEFVTDPSENVSATVLLNVDKEQYPDAPYPQAFIHIVESGSDWDVKYPEMVI